MANYKPIHLAREIFQPSKSSTENLSPVIFLHDLTVTKESWNTIPQIVAEKTNRKTYTYDARNHGDSEYTDEYCYDLNVEDLFHFMDTMNISKAILIGHGMGGLTACYAALKKPERVEKVFAEDIHLQKHTQDTVKNIIPSQLLRIESLKHLPPNIDESDVPKFSADYIISKLPLDSPIRKYKDQLYKSRFYIKRTNEGGFEFKYNTSVIIRALQNIDTLMSDLSGQYEGSAYFIYADKCHVQVGSETDHIRTYFPSAEFIEFKTETHNIHLDFQEKFIDVILKHL